MMDGPLKMLTPSNRSKKKMTQGQTEGETGALPISGCPGKKRKKKERRATAAHAVAPDESDCTGHHPIAACAPLVEALRPPAAAEPNVNHNAPEPRRKKTRGAVHTPASLSMLDEIELPCDWTVNRRPVLPMHLHAHDQRATAAAPVANRSSSSQPDSGVMMMRMMPPTTRQKKAQQQRGGVPRAPHGENAAADVAEDPSPGGIASSAMAHDVSPDPNKEEEEEEEEDPKREAAGRHTPAACGGGGFQPHILGPCTVLVEDVGAVKEDDATTATNEASACNSSNVRKLVLRQLLASSSSSSTASASAMMTHAGDEAGTSSIDTDSLLSRLPYRRMLNDMFGGSLKGRMRDAHVPYVTRAYEEAFMREPMHSSERECARGRQHCECMFIDRSQSFVGVEFLLPGEALPRTPHLCVLCCRAATQQLYYDVMFDKTDFPGTIQRYGNIHSQPGEYALDAMLIAMPSVPVHIMPLPIVSHQRNRYVVYVSGGIRRLKQSRVYFHSTPSHAARDGM